MKETWTNIVLITLVLGATYLLISLMRQKHASHIYALWVGFAAAFVLPFPVAWMAHKEHWISSKGEFLGDWGKRLENSMSVMVDVSGELYLLLGLIGTLIAVQILAYAFAAPSGCASDFRFVSRSISTSTLLFLKSLVSAAGIFLSLLCNNAIYGWDARLSAIGWDIAFFVFASIFVSFGLLLSYFEVPGMLSSAVQFTSKHCPALHARFGRIHQAATKYQKSTANKTDIADLINMSSTISRIIESRVNEDNERRKDIKHLLDLIADVASFDATRKANKACGRENDDSGADLAVRNQKQVQIEELRSKWEI